MPMFSKRRQRQWKQGNYLYLSDSNSNLLGAIKPKCSDAAVSGKEEEPEREKLVGCNSISVSKSEVLSPCHAPKSNSLVTGTWMGSSLLSPSPLSPQSAHIILASPACSSITTANDTPTTPRTASSFRLEDHNFHWLTNNNESQNMTMGLSFETATAVQKSYTSWPSTIWDINFDDADEEIVFEEDNDDDSIGDNNHGCHLPSVVTNRNNETVAPKSCSVENNKANDEGAHDAADDFDNITLETEDETMPSACASPDFSTAWELEELDLSVIEDVSEDEDEGFFSCDDETSEEEDGDNVDGDDEFYDSFDLPQLSPVTNGTGSSLGLGSSPQNRDEDCPLLACSTDLKNRFLGATTSNERRQRQPASLFRGVLEDASSSPSITSTSSNSNCSRQSYFEIEESFGLAHGGRPDASLSPVDPRKHLRKRSICFADEVGKTMEVVHLVDRRDDDDCSNASYGPTLQRLLVLFLCPEEKKFEFVHAEYSTQQSRVAVSSLLEQVTKFVTDTSIAKKEYIRLCTADGTELINALSIQEYGLQNDEVVVAVLKGYTGATMHSMAKGLIQNDEILKAVKQTNRSEHTLFRVKSNGELYEIQKQAREIQTSNLSKLLLQENHEEQLVEWRSLGSTKDEKNNNNSQKCPSGGTDENMPSDQSHDDMKRLLLASPLRDASSNNICVKSASGETVELTVPGTQKKEKITHSKENGSSPQSTRSKYRENNHKPYRRSLLPRNSDTADLLSISTKKMTIQLKLLQPSWKKSTSTTCRPGKDRLENGDCLSSDDGRKNVKRLNFGFLQRQSFHSDVVVEPLKETNLKRFEEAAQETSPSGESVASNLATTRKVNWASRVAKKGWKNLKSIGTKKRGPGKA